MTESKETKNLRITKNQKEKLVEYMSTHLDFARGQFGGMNSNVQNKGDWVLLTTTLNSLGGSMKTTDQWKKCWIDLKSGVKKKINSRRSFLNKTGGGSIKDAPHDLNDFEEQILGIMGTHAVDGDSTTIEAGVAPLTEPIFSIEILEDEDMHEYSPDAEPFSSVPTAELPTNSKQSLKNERPHINYNKGMEEARQMHAELVNSIATVEKNIELKIEKVDSKMEEIKKQNNDLLLKFDFLIDLLNKDN